MRITQIDIWKWGIHAALIGLVLLLGIGQAAAQGPATPIPVNPPTGTATAPPPTDAPTRTPTSLGPASAEALADGTNVRSQPDISAERLGQISPGQNFAVLGKYFEWYQIEYPDAPGGTGWVHQSVVQINGDPNLIPDFTLEEVPTENPTITTGRQTAEAITATPGAALTFTAQAQITPSGVFTLPPDAAGGVAPPQTGGNAILPTYTYPPITHTPINPQEYTRGAGRTPSDEGLPPIVPILGLIGLGSLGLLLSSLRRS